MVSIATFRQVALSFPEAIEQPHFEGTSFSVAKKIFATLDSKANLACIKLSEIDQDVFSAFDPAIIYPVANKWGKKRATYINLKKVRKDLLLDALTTAYCEVGPKKLSSQLQAQREKLIIKQKPLHSGEALHLVFDYKGIIL